LDIINAVTSIGIGNYFSVKAILMNGDAIVSEVAATLSSVQAGSTSTPLYNGDWTIDLTSNVIPTFDNIVLVTEIDGDVFKNGGTSSIEFYSDHSLDDL
jgi:hypothetical protein